MSEYESYEVEWVEALQARADRWEAEARILGREGAEAAELLAGVLGYSDPFHTDAPLGTSILLFLVRKAAESLTGEDAHTHAWSPSDSSKPCVCGEMAPAPRSVGAVREHEDRKAHQSE